MKKWEAMVGRSFLGRLDEVILEIGETTFTCREMIDKLHCGNFAAAKNLSWALERFKPENARELARRVDIEDLFVIKGVGVTTVYVWMCVLDALGKSPEKWLDQEVTLPTLYAKRHNKRRRQAVREVA